MSTVPPLGTGKTWLVGGDQLAPRVQPRPVSKHLEISVVHAVESCEPPSFAIMLNPSVGGATSFIVAPPHKDTSSPSRIRK